MSEAIARSYLKEGKIKAIGRSVVRQLVWMGADSAETTGYDRAQGPFFYRRAKYVYKHASNSNPENCWTLIYIRPADHIIFFEVVASAGALIRIQGKKRKRA